MKFSSRIKPKPEVDVNYSMKLDLPLYLQVLLIGASLYALVVIFIPTGALPPDGYWLKAAHLCMFLVFAIILWQKLSGNKQPLNDN